MDVEKFNKALKTKVALAKGYERRNEIESAIKKNQRYCSSYKKSESGSNRRSSVRRRDYYSRRRYSRRNYF